MHSVLRSIWSLSLHRVAGRGLTKHSLRSRLYFHRQVKCFQRSDASHRVALFRTAMMNTPNSRRRPPRLCTIAYLHTRNSAHTSGSTVRHIVLPRNRPQTAGNRAESPHLANRRVPLRSPSPFDAPTGVYHRMEQQYRPQSTVIARVARQPSKGSIGQIPNGL